MSKYVAYYRVSTQKQGQSGLGLEAQRASVANFIQEAQRELVEEFTEVETGKGANALDMRPQLKLALDTCRRTGASLLIAKLDRLARNVHFITGLIETGCDFIAVDMPHANKVMLQIHAVMSEYERDQISARTKAALQAAKTRGVSLGKAGPINLKPNIENRKRHADEFASNLDCTIKAFQAAKMTQRQIVRELNRLEVGAPRGGKWTLIQYQRTSRRLLTQNN